MKTTYITVTGLNHYYGSKFIERDMEVTLSKEPDNKYDSEAIMVTMPGLGKIGYVANSTNTKIGESTSAGRIYDRFDNEAKAKVLYILPQGVLCELMM